MGNQWCWGPPSLRNTKFATQRHAKSSSQSPLVTRWPGQPLRLGGCMKFTLSGGGAISPDVQVGKSSNCWGISRTQAMEKNTGGDVRSVQHTSQTLVTAWWWLEPWNLMTFHILWRIIPTDELIFYRGVGQPPTRTCLVSSSGMGADSLWLSSHSRLRLDA